LAEFARHGDFAFAGIGDGLDRQRIAAGFRPGQTVDEPDAAFRIDFAVVVFGNTGIVFQVARGDIHLFAFFHQNLFHAFAGNVGDFALQVTDAGRARVIAD